MAECSLAWTNQRDGGPSVTYEALSEANKVTRRCFIFVFFVADERAMLLHDCETQVCHGPVTFTPANVPPEVVALKMIVSKGTSLSLVLPRHTHTYTRCM
jgi:hypothetical protein